MNPLEITGLFDDLTIDQAVVIAKILANSWSLKLQKEVEEAELARAIYDRKTGEVFVTISVPE